jgi:hypothetical protein
MDKSINFKWIILLLEKSDFIDPKKNGLSQNVPEMMSYVACVLC